MKELTIEQKAQRYNEALERAKGVIEQNPLMEYLKKGIEYIFPELKESEDEKIRKELLNAFKEATDSLYVVLTPSKREAFIAWLEKQGKHANFRNKIKIGDKVTRNEDGVLVNLSQLKRVAKKDEKQGEPTEINPSEFDLRLNKLLKQFESMPKEELASSLSFYLNVVQNNGTYKDEKQGEHKPADNAEPKFKVKYAGSEYNVLEVKDIAGVTYYGIEDEPNHIDYVQAENCERISGYSIKENGSPYPTKPAKFSEQKPADTENGTNGNDREIPISEQKPNTDFSDLRTWKYIVDAVWTEKEGIGQYLDSPFTEEVAKKLQKRFGNIEQKPAWSDEDEKFVHGLIRGLAAKRDIHGHTTFSSDCIDITQTINWLKSLKQRIGG